MATRMFVGHMIYHEVFEDKVERAAQHRYVPIVKFIGR
jgi:hypothetical protein